MAKPFDIMNEDDRLIAGWASVEVLDAHGDIVPVDELRRGMYVLIDRGGNILYGHSNKPVGKILGWEIKKHPETDTDGLWIVAKIYKEYPLDDEVWRLVKDGLLRGFSIGAQGKKEKMVLKDTNNSNLPREINVIRDLNLMEISIVPTPANPLAKIEEINYVAKSIDGGGESENVGKLHLDSILEKYKIGKDLFNMTEGCGLCSEISSIIKDVGDVDLGVRVWRAIQLEKEKSLKSDKLRKYDDANIKRMYEGVERMGFPADDFYNEHVVKKFKELQKTIDELKEYEKLVSDIRIKKFEDENKPTDYFAVYLEKQLSDLWKTFIEIQKPFGKWESFDSCVSDMKRQGYSEESAKRICGSLQAKLEEKLLDEAVEKYQSTLRDFGFPEWSRSKWPRKRRAGGRQTSMAEFVRSGQYLKAAVKGLDDVCAVLEKAGEDYEPLLAIIDSVYDLAKRVDENADVLKSKRPPEEWFHRCVERTGRPALCGWVFYHHLYPRKPETKKEPDKPYTRAARARKRALLGV